MKTIEEFLSDLNSLDIKIWNDDHQLCYDAPQGTLTPVLRSELIERKQEILAFLHQANLASSYTLKSIPEFPRRGNLPLSFAQQRLWFLNQWQPDSSFYNESIAFSLQGSLNIAALTQSLNEIVRRHEALRTNFVSVDGQPSQIIASSLTLILPVVNLQDLPEIECEAEAERLIAGLLERPFNLAEDPLLHMTLLQFSETKYVMLLTMHHIVCDGWSMGIFFQELVAFYEAFCNGKPSPLPKLPIQYGDFAIWQHQWLQGEVLANQLTYWRLQLHSHPPALNLPTDHSRPAVQSFHGATQSFYLPIDVMEALKALSCQEKGTLFMTLLAAFQTLLHRYSGQNDILVGSPIANRNQSETEGLIGFFVNTLVLRIYLGGNPSFRELLGRVREVTLEAYAHQDLPFEKLVEELQPERNLSHHPLFQVMFVLQNAPSLDMKLPSLSLSFLKLENQTAKFDLSLSMQETSSGLKGEFEYNTDLFETATISRMIGHFQNLLQSIVANPEQHLCDLCLLSVTERQQLVVEWNNTQTDYPQEQFIHQLFESSVERSPNAVAVVFEDKQLTYRELNHQANKIAHYLQSLGVGPEILVGICMERSLLMVVGILGILKAGGAYVPLDPSYPQQRLALMLADAKPLVLLTQARLVTGLPQHGAQLVCLDTDWEANTFGCAKQYPQDNLVNNVTAKNLAYVIFTSGSTGTPKGVAITLQALVNHSTAVAKAYQLQADDRILQFASISFDVAVEELFSSWLSGSTVVIRPDQALVMTNFQQFIKQEKLTVLNLPTAYWHEWVSYLVQQEVSLLTTLRLVIVGTESVLPEKLVLWQKLVDHLCEKPPFGHLRIRWLNAYGPTETTVGATIYEPVRQENQQLARVPIGHPITNTQVYLLDQYLNPTPIGIPGELYIGGISLARGYLNRSDLTAEKFIPNPFSKKVGTQLYRTGDWARYLPDGEIEYLGRIDQQVKVRGFRVELEEIKAVLAKHLGVRETVVLDKETQAGNKQLVAYVVSHSDRTLTIDELRDFLKLHLPDYMIPSVLVLLDAMPLMPNGKVDRRALPTLDNSRLKLEKDFLAPRDPLELQLTQIWEEILDVLPVGVQDNFFEIGGHSLLAVRLIAQIQKQFGYNLPLSTLFQGTTIEKLATILRQQTHSQPSSPLVAIQPSGSKPPLFFVHPVGGNVLCYYQLALHLGADQPFYGLQSLGLNGESQPYTRIEDMAYHYIKALRAVQAEGPYFLGGWSMGGVVAFEIAQQLHKQGYKVNLLALLDSLAPVESNKTTDYEYDNAKLLANFAQDMAGSTGKSLSVFDDKLKQLDIDEQLNHFLEQAKIANFVPPDIGKQQLHYLVQVFKSNIQAVLNYVPQVYPNRIILFQASNIGELSNPTLGWDELSSKPVELIYVPSEHYTMLSLPHVQLLKEQLKLYLD
ncbi:MAG: amino acid adenylation domain-containing protein [Rhizonema sp. PD38]|nr:amino acid adenylation domain-containing protein [Rhizonema sp. PD38]